MHTGGGGSGFIKTLPHPPLSLRNRAPIQCVSLDSTSLIIYPEIKATEVSFQSWKCYLCSFYFRMDNETGGIYRNTVYKPQWKIYSMLFLILPELLLLSDVSKTSLSFCLGSPILSKYIFLVTRYKFSFWVDHRRTEVKLSWLVLGQHHIYIYPAK